MVQSFRYFKMWLMPNFGKMRQIEMLWTIEMDCECVRMDMGLVGVKQE